MNWGKLSVKNNCSMGDKNLLDCNIPPSVEIKFMKAFCKFPYPSQTQLLNFSLESGLSLKQVSNWFEMKRLKNRISWSPAEIEYAKDVIAKYNKQREQNVKNNSEKLPHNNNASKKESVNQSVPSTSAQEENLASSSQSQVIFFYINLFVFNYNKKFLRLFVRLLLYHIFL